MRQLIQPAPWSFHLADTGRLSVVAAIDGCAAITLHDNDSRATTAEAPEIHRLDSGDIALIKGGDYTVSDDPATPCQLIIRDGHKHRTGPDAADLDRMIAPRTFGTRRDDAITTLHGIYELHDSVGDRLLELLPACAVVPATPRTLPLLEFLSAEAARDEPGQDAVLNRLLDLLLIVSLRTWGARTDFPTPNWLAAVADPTIGAVLSMMHAEPQRRWTTTAFAHRTRMSRAALCARFTALVGTPPMTYLTSWRMALAADTLRHTDATVSAVAHEVGYDSPFSFSTAFKRAHGQSPAGWRRGVATATSRNS